MSLASDFIRAVVDAGGRAELLKPEDTQSLVSALRAKFSRLEGRDEERGQLWDHVEWEFSRHDPSGWKGASSLIKSPGAELIVLIEDYAGMTGVRLGSPLSLERALAEMVGFVFYLTDDAAAYLVCFNDHDVLLAVGAAAP
jgi:hypothetical protein